LLAALLFPCWPEEETACEPAGWELTLPVPLEDAAALSEAAGCEGALSCALAVPCEETACCA